MEYNKELSDHLQRFEEVKVRVAEEERQAEIKRAYQFDNSLRSEWIHDIDLVFVRDSVTLGIWEGAVQVMLDMMHAYCQKKDLPADHSCLRMFMVNDPMLMQSHSAQAVEVFYRTAEIPHQDKNVPFSPWPDLFLGEFFMLYQNGRESQAVATIQDRLGSGANIRRERITDHALFPKTLEEAKEASRNHLWFPGTNVPVEDMTDNLYHELAQTLPDEMAF